MRLWHEQIINILPKNQLLGQHRECCALRGNGWMKKHRTVDYVFLYSPYHLFTYQQLLLLNIYLYFLNFLCIQPDIHYYALYKLDCL